MERADAFPYGKAELILDEADDDLDELEASPSEITTDPIFLHLRDWLYLVLRKSQGETIIDADGRRWDVMEPPPI